MTFMEKVVKKNIPIWDVCAEIPFVKELQEALKAQVDGADYLGVGAMLPTKTKEDAKIVPVSELCQIRLAVISAILAQPDIRQVAEELRNICRACSFLRAMDTHLLRVP